MNKDDQKGVKWCSGNMVLIPSRNEYMSAGLNPILWWTRDDYNSFKQSANSEIRLFSVHEGINMKEASKKLYQPQACDLTDDSYNEDDDYYVEDVEDAIDDNTSTDEVTGDNNNERNECSFPLQRSDSLDCMSSLKQHEQNGSPKRCLMRAKDSAEFLSSFKHSSEIITPDEYLSFCVPLKEPVVLIEKETRKREGKKKNDLSSIIVLGSFVLLVILWLR